MIVVESEHNRRFTLDQMRRLTRPVLSVLSDGRHHILAFEDEHDRLLLRRADGYYSDEFGFAYDALFLVELDENGTEIDRAPMGRVITVKQPIHA